ncbi:hypothetical protein SNE40_000309 [Patella caerulea]|uniref:Uncharacterized protein n=1 Tax=Patella caerulea TaxID=87958 RepID=A0AAN8KDK3_PATCE
MEYTPEIAVLQASFEFAEKRIGCKLSTLQKINVVKLSEVIEEAIKDILIGLEEDLSEFDQKWWNSKLHCIFLYKALENEINEPGCQRETALYKLCHLLPNINLAVYFEAVKTFDWFEFFIEIPDFLGEAERKVLCIKALEHVQETPVNHQDLQLASSVIGQFILVWLKKTPFIHSRKSTKVDTNATQLSEEIKFNEFLSVLLDYLSSHGDQIKLMDLKILKQCMYRVLTIPILTTDPQLFFNEISRDLLDSYKARNRSFFAPYVPNHSITSQKNAFFEVNDFPCSSWLNCVNLLLNILNDVDGVLNDPSIFVGDFKIPTKIIAANLLSIRDQICGNLPENLLQQRDDIFNFIGKLFREQKLASEIIGKQKNEEETLVQSCIKRIKAKQPGFEADIEKILSNSDLQVWLNEGYLDMFINNSCLLYKERYQYRLYQIYSVWIRQKHNSEIQTKFSQLICLVFRNLPLLLQEKFILYVYLQSESTSSVSLYIDTDITSTFNRFTSQSTKQILQEVSCLMLVDLKSTMKRLVDTVISNPAQINTVLQILQSIPKLCQCRHINIHPDTSLLVTLLQDALLTTELTKDQEKNLLKFISSAVQEYKYEIMEDQFICEQPPVNLGEFINTCILPYMNSDEFNSCVSTISLNFTLKLFTTVLDKSVNKSRCDWLLELNHVVILSMIGEIYNGCVDGMEDHRKRMLIRQSVNKFLASLKTALRTCGYCVELSSMSWLMKDIEDVNWIVKIILHKFLSDFITDGNNLHKKLLEELMESVFAQSDESLAPLFQFCILNEGTSALIHQHLDQLSSHNITSELLITSLSTLLSSSLVSSEWMRLYQLLYTMIQKNILTVPIRLIYLDKIIPTHIQDNVCLLGAIQLINDVILMIIPVLPDGIIQHIISSYTTLIQMVTKQMDLRKTQPQIISLALVQIFSYGTVTMASVAIEIQDVMFVCLLDILGKMKELKLRSGVDVLYVNSFKLAINSVSDTDMKKTLVNKINSVY